MSHYQLTQVYLQALFGNLLDRVRLTLPFGCRVVS